MSYSALVRRLLISCPGDVPATDLAVVHKAINRWNGVYGKAFGAAIVPISWGTHAAAEFGRPPQAILNRQLVDECDICLALFANRLGTPTQAAESGTAEEIERFGTSGRYVGILRSQRPVNASRIDLGQAQKLEAYLERMKENAPRDQGRADLQLQESPGQTPTGVAEVWPRIDSSETVRILGGQSVPRRNWYLVLVNNGDAPAHNVRVRLESSSGQGNPPQILGDSPESAPEVEVLAPHGEVRFHLLTAMGDTTQVRCIVSWTDDRGEQENTATLRLT